MFRVYSIILIKCRKWVFTNARCPAGIKAPKTSSRQSTGIFKGSPMRI